MMVLCRLLRGLCPSAAGTSPTCAGRVPSPAISHDISPTKKHHPHPSPPPCPAHLPHRVEPHLTPRPPRPNPSEQKGGRFSEFTPKGYCDDDIKRALNMPGPADYPAPRLPPVEAPLPPPPTQTSSAQANTPQTCPTCVSQSMLDSRSVFNLHLLTSICECTRNLFLYSLKRLSTTSLPPSPAQAL